MKINGIKISIEDILIDGKIPFSYISYPWNVSTTAFLQLFSVVSEETLPRGLFISPSGTKMYVTGDEDEVNEYTLSTAWDVSTAVFVQLFDVSGEDLSPHGVHFNTTGTKMYVLGEVGVDVNEYTLSTAWDVSSAVYAQNFVVSPQESTPRGLFFRDDGLKMYIAGYKVNEYTLSTAWDVSTAVWVQELTISSQVEFSNGVFFSPSGTKMFLIDINTDDVSEWRLSTAWDISTAVWLQSFNVTAQDVGPADIFFNLIGSKMYVTGVGSKAVNEYNL